MSSAGHVMAMISSLKNNSRRKKSFGERFEHEHGKFKTAFHDKSIPKEELEIIKLEIRATIKREQSRKYIFTLMTCFIVVVVLTISYLEFSEHIIKLQHSMFTFR